MIKRILAFLVQLIAFFALMDIGGNWDAIRLGQEVRAMVTHTQFWNPMPAIVLHVSTSRILIANGVIFASVLLLIILLFEILRNKLHPWIAITMAAFLIAVITALLLKIGLPPAPSPDASLVLRALGVA